MHEIYFLSKNGKTSLPSDEKRKGKKENSAINKKNFLEFVKECLR